MAGGTRAPEAGPQKIRVMIVDDIADTRENLKKLLYFEKNIEIIAEAGSGREAVALAKQHKPNVVLMDINMPDMDGLAATETILSQVPGVQVIIMSVQGEQDYLRKAMMVGAREFLIKPFSADELVTAINKIYELAPQQQPARQSDSRYVSNPGGPSEPEQLGQIIAVFSPKGGSGTSTIAANLAVAVRQLTNKRVALVDGNLVFGDIGVIMNLFSTKTISDLANRVDEVDRELLNDVLATHATQVKILLAPPNPQTGELVSADHLKQILERMRSEFDYIIVDTQSSFQDKALAVLDIADRIVTLMTLEMTCIKNIRQFLEVAELLEYPAEKTMLVLNKADGSLGIRVENVEESIRHKVVLQIPNANHEMTLAVNQGVPLVVEKRDHRTSKAIVALASLITNSRGTAAPAGKKGSEPKLQEKSGLFGRLIPKR